MTETELIIRLREGDEEAFRELVNSYSDRVYNTVFSIIQQREDAEDIAQDVFIRVFHSIKSFAGNAALSTWLYRIAVNLSLEHLRKQKTQKRFAIFRTLFGSDNELNAAIDFYHPGVALDRKEDSALLFKAIKMLPPKQQAAFILNKTEGLSYTAIAEVMEITEAAVDALLQRAKQNLRKNISRKNY